MAERRGIVFVSENEEAASRSGERWLTGTFRASWQAPEGELEAVDELSATDAVAWGRARSDAVRIRLGAGPYFWAGTGRGRRRGEALWPPEDLPALVRRRHPDQDGPP